MEKAVCNGDHLCLSISFSVLLPGKIKILSNLAVRKGHILSVASEKRENDMNLFWAKVF